MIKAKHLPAVVARAAAGTAFIAASVGIAPVAVAAPAGTATATVEPTATTMTLAEGTVRGDSMLWGIPNR